MVLRSAQLQELWGEPIAGPTDPERTILSVSTDSRGSLENVLFVPLVGERIDAHRFLAGALPRCGAAVAEPERIDRQELQELCATHGRPLWLVPDTLAAYQQVARLWRRCLGKPVVAVTGSAGKTTTRELIRAALSGLGPVVASQGNENNDIGAPLTLLRADRDTAALVVEMGMRGLGEIERLSLCAEPDVAVITNIGTAHIGRLGSREAIATAKSEITAQLRPDGVVVIPAGDPLLESALAAVWSGRVQRVALADEVPGFDPALPAADWIATWSAPATGEAPSPEAETVGSMSVGSLSVESQTVGSQRVGSQRVGSLQLPGWPPVALPLAGRHNARNLLLALAVARELGVPREALTALEVEVPGGRSRRLEIGGVQVFDETYNASPEAMLAALDLLAAAPLNGRRFAVLGTMLELGEQSEALHRQVGERAAQWAARGRLDGLVIVAGGAEGAALQAGAGDAVQPLLRVETPDQAAAPLGRWLRPGDGLLLKASRGVALEKLLPLLESLELG